MISPGDYRAVTTLTIELCQRTGEFTAPRVLEYVTYDPGDTFTIPRSIGGFFYRVMEDPSREEAPGRWERIPAEPR